MADRSSRPHRQPNRTPQPVVRKIVHLRWKQRLGPVEIGDRLGMPSSTVHAVLVRCRLNRLTHIDRATGEPIRRYEHERPGDLIHVDVKKLGKVPDGGGWRYVGRQQGYANRSATATHRHAAQQVAQSADRHLLPAHRHRRPLPSRLRRSPRRRDQGDRRQVLRNAVAWFADRGVTVQRVLSDNGSCYKSHLWRETCLELGITPKKTRPYRPQTNGKIERFHRTLAEGWAFKKFYNSESARLPLCQHGSTSTTTTGPTRPSGSAHPSPGWTTWLGITPREPSGSYPPNLPRAGPGECLHVAKRTRRSAPAPQVRYSGPDGRRSWRVSQGW